jgi:hypothetical protein
LLAALEIAGGQVVTHVKQRRTSVNFLRFLKDVVGAFPDRDSIWFSTTSTSTKIRPRAALAETASSTHIEPGSMGRSVMEMHLFWASRVCHKVFIPRSAN